MQETPADSSSSFAALYKTPSSKNSQAQRRDELLKAIKQRRHTSIDEKRSINEVFTCSHEASETMEFETTAKNTRKRRYANKLMLSEWMLEKPEDLEEAWLLKLCPKGVRSLVVAHKGKTKSYTKSGHFLREFPSQLPGGSTSSLPMKFTILDCVFSAALRTYFVLDVLVWSSYSVMYSTSEFRFFFIASKLAESGDLLQVSKGNKFIFAYLEHYSADYQSIGERFSIFDKNFDGALFYHKDVCYLSRVTPLVGWLKAFMLAEILNVSVHCDYMREKPPDYCSLLKYVENYEAERKKKGKSKCFKQQDAEMGEDSFSSTLMDE